MKEVVWVFGVSASGKETFIRNIGRYTDVQEQLKWINKSVVACEASLKYIGQREDDPVVSRREEILSQAPVLLDTAEVVLIKWQYVDSDALRPQRLKALLPNAQHRIIELNVPKTELIERIARKPWWDDYGKEEESVTAELEMVGNEIDVLRGEFEVIILNYTGSDHTWSEL